MRERERERPAQFFQLRNFFRGIRNDLATGVFSKSFSIIYLSFFMFPHIQRQREGKLYWVSSEVEQGN